MPMAAFNTGHGAQIIYHSRRIDMNSKQVRIISDDIFNGHFLGYTQLFDRFANMHSNSFPPHNVVLTGEDTRNIEFALAGFSTEDIHIIVENGELTVEGVRGENDAKEYLHQGISRRGFIKTFSLAEYWVVEKAEFQNGILTISVKQEIPEDKKPKTIKIKSKA